MTLDRGIFLRLFVGAFGLTIVAFVVRGTATLAVGSDTAQTIAAPLFVLAILCAVAGFVLSVTVKLQSVFGGEPVGSDR